MVQVISALQSFPWQGGLVSKLLDNFMQECEVQIFAFQNGETISYVPFVWKRLACVGISFSLDRS